MYGTLTHAWNVAQSIVREKRKGRSPHWHAVEAAWLAKNGFCAACGCRVRLQVHHVRPYHLDPALELDLKNLLTLCMGPNECHLKIAHGGDWRSYAPDVRELASAVLSGTIPRRQAEAQAKSGRLYADPLEPTKGRANERIGQ